MANKVTSACGAASSPDFGKCLIGCMMEWLQSKPALQAGQASRFRKLLVLLFPGSSQEASFSLAVSSFVLAAHPSIRPSDGSFMWVSLVTQARLDIAEVVSLHSQQLMDILRVNLSRGPEDTWWGAALEGAKLLAFISPEKAATTLMTMAIDYLQPTTFTTEDVAIWKTPQGTMYRDVLKKGHQVAEDHNRKGAALDKWEKEVREQLATKKGNMPKLSKEDQELVTAQLAKEAAVRDAVQTHFISLQNGILLTKAVVGGLKISGILYDLPAACEPLLTRLLMRMFSVVRHKLASSLLRGQGVKGWLDLSMVCAPELNDLPTLTAIASLRSCDVLVPLEWQGEPLEELLSRLLFRLQMTTSRKRLDPPAFSYMFPLLERILLTGGVGFSPDTVVSVKDSGHDDDQPSLQVEQVTLALDVLGNHASLCANSAMPRLGMITALLRVIETQPKLNPTALDYLLQLSEGLGQSVIDPKEVELLATGLLSESLFVRKACLQSLGSLDLAGCAEWANIWILCFSPDTTEKQLATALWEGNALSVPDDFCSVLCGLLTSDVPHIRTSAANSFYEAISLHPSSLPNVFDALCQLYFKLAEPIVPEYDRFGMLIQASLERTDPFGQRVAVGLALGGIVPLADRSLLELFLGFMITQEALADVHAHVRKAMLQASLEAIHHHGQTHMKPIMAILQHTLDQPDANSQSQDYIREGAVILYGTLARNLKSGAKEIPDIISKLIQTLDTPSERAVCRSRVLTASDPCCSHNSSWFDSIVA
ncbi:translational activator of GCN4 [Entomophthora muscae]|uniref:Translational activator of GCN4 n=1 Tax=Entomophthora muscae TaxID=34485 RepID=A0ACC2TXJ9_9FUNG|nr:translational activator of GCN4 [Entomophthora muscae]